MEIDLGIEHIQPLRGRNVALHAETDSEYQKELLQQKEAFEEAIRSYEGDDPLDDWYNYASWVEQSYPKHGHDDNLLALLDNCLSNFETDERYTPDRRMCKLWIKFVDLQQNHLELFQLLHSRGICVACADLYRAWAYYYEVAEDYKRADAVFQLGIQALAQPYEELVAAHQNFFSAIGKQAIHGVDGKRLVEQRQVLTSLCSYTHKRTTVTSRTGSQAINSTPGTLLEKMKSSRGSNAPIMLYEEQETAGVNIGVTSMSILAVARRQDISHKENILKPSPLNLKRNIITPRVANRASVHEDERVGIQLPPDFAPMNYDVFSDVKPSIYYLDAPNPNARPMYPKELVYAEPDVDYSLEEIRARTYLPNLIKAGNASVNMREITMVDASVIQSCLYQYPNMETVAQSIQPIANESISCKSLQISYQEEVPQPIASQLFLSQIVTLQTESNKSCASSFIGDSFKSHQHNLSERDALFPNVQNQVSPEIPQVAEEVCAKTFILRRSAMSEKLSLYEDQEPGETNTPKQQPQTWVPKTVATAEQWLPEPVPKTLEKKDVPWNTIVDNNYTVNQDINYIWTDDTLPEPIVAPKPQMSTFKIHEDSKFIQDDVDPSLPDNKSLTPIVNVKAPIDDKMHKQVLISGLMNRKSIKTPFSSQPLPEPIREYRQQSKSQDFVHPSEVIRKQPLVNYLQNNSVSNFNDSCTTQTFNFEIKPNQISTPLQDKKAHPYKINASIFNIEPQRELKQSKKVLFDEENEAPPPEMNRTPEKLSIILETTKEYGSSSSSSSCGLTLKTTTFNHRESLQTIQESSWHDEDDFKSKTQLITDENRNFNDNNEGSNINNYNALRQFIDFDTLANPQQCNGETSPNNYGSQHLQNVRASVDQSQHVIDLTEENDVSSMNRGEDTSNYHIQSKSNFEFATLKD